MGTFRIEIQGVGGHGCQREVKSGEKVTADCGSAYCPDCLARAFVKSLADKGMLGQYPTTDPGSLVYAKLIHWPYGHGTVTDDLITRVRSGNF
jgi:hypothetical protein